MSNLQTRAPLPSQNLPVVDEAAADPGSWKDSDDRTGTDRCTKSKLSVDPCVHIVQDGDRTTKLSFEFLANVDIFPPEIRRVQHDALIHIDRAGTADPNPRQPREVDATTLQAGSNRLADAIESRLRLLGRLRLTTVLTDHLELVIVRLGQHLRAPQIEPHPHFWLSNFRHHAS